MDTFIFGLSLIGVPIPLGLAGGTHTVTQTVTELATTKTKPAERKVLSLKKGPAIEEEPLEITAYKQTYNDMAAHLEFIIDMIFLDNYSGIIPKEEFEKVGYEAFQKFFKRVFGPDYRVDPKILAGLAAQRRFNKQAKSMGGGDYIAFKADIIKEVFEKEGLKEEPAGGAGAAAVLKEDPKLFNETKPFLTSQFSIMNLYEEIVGRETEESLEARIDRIMSLRPLETRLKILGELKEKREYIKSLISQIKNEEGKVWEFLEGDNAEEEGNAVMAPSAVPPVVAPPAAASVAPPPFSFGYAAQQVAPAPYFSFSALPGAPVAQQEGNAVMALGAVPAAAPVAPPPTHKKRKRSNVETNQQAANLGKQAGEPPRKKPKGGYTFKKGRRSGTRRKLKESKLRTIKKKRINRRRRTQRR